MEHNLLNPNVNAEADVLIGFCIQTLGMASSHLKYKMECKGRCFARLSDSIVENWRQSLTINDAMERPMFCSALVLLFCFEYALQV